MDITSTKRLNNGVEIPVLGLGVYKSGENTKNAVLNAFKAGYRMIDTASVYGNEAYVGQAMRESKLPRREIFITTKIWNDDLRAKRTREAARESLDRLGLDYVDLLLIHWPVKGCFNDSWKVMEELYDEGKARAIGVSNFEIHHLMELMSHAKIVPVMNQIECHPYLNQRMVRAFCRNLDIAVTAWSPLATGLIFEDKDLMRIAQKYNKSVAQVTLRYELQEGMVVIPKSVHPDRIQSNRDLFDFELSDEDMEVIRHLNKDQRLGAHPDSFTF